MNTDIEKTLESLELIADDGNFAIFQAPAKKGTEWAVMEDNGGTLHMWVKDSNGRYVFASPVMPEDVENAGAWDEDLIMLQQVMNERNCK